MRYPPALLDEIRARLPASSVVGRKVRLKKAGREWKGLSPFQSEKTPSFFVNDQKGFYHCFSSGKHGDIFTFLMETEGLSFPEAVERLAAEAGVPLPKASREAQAEAERRRDLYDVLETACRFFEARLRSASGATAREYLARRLVAQETQAEFRLGFAPDDRTALINHLRGQGIQDDEIVEAGLAIQPDDSRPIYDRFRGRLIIPIQDINGRVVAFGGRALQPEQEPKYLNSPETTLFRKGELVFNGHRARAAAFKANTVVVVEGYLDAISVHQAGFKPVVATLGTALTEEQIATLWQRFAPEPVICLDGDKAGQAAAFRAVDRLLPILKTGFTVKFAFLPSGQDPDDLVKTSGIGAFQKAIDQAQPFWDVLWARETASARLDTPDGQAVFEARIKELTAAIRDEALRRRYQLTARLQVSDFLWQAGKRRARERLSHAAATPRLPNLFSSEPTRLIGLERIFLGMCVHFPDVMARRRDRIAGMRFRGQRRETAFGDFAHDLLRVTEEHEVHGCGLFYDTMSDGYFDMLDFLHGRQKMLGGVELLPAGHNLFARFPILLYVVPERFIEECFDNFYELLWLRDLEDELKESQAAIPPDDDEQVTRLLHLQRMILDNRDRVLKKELDLAEEAGGYRSSGGMQYRIAPDPTGMRRAREHALVPATPVQD